MESSARLIINRPSVIYDVQGGEAVIIDLSVGHYYRLEESGSILWERFSSGTSIADLLQTCRNVDAFRPEVLRIVEELVDHGLVRHTHDSEAISPPAGDWQFDGFDLQRFVDLEDILGLDPIHEVDPSRGWPYSNES